MKSAVFFGPHDLRVVEKPIPEPRDGEVLLRVMACGVCGTDVHIFEGEQGAADCPSGTTLGHEFAGVIERVGRGVTAFSVGDRVSVDPNKLCGECGYCRSGIGHFCTSMVGIGTTVDGGFAEFCAVPQSQLCRIADATSFEAAAMTEPVSCCLHGIDLCGIRAGETVAVIGGGMIGQIMLGLALRSGAAKAILIEPVEGKRELGRKLGATLTLDPFTEDVRTVLERERIGRIGVVIECVGSVRTAETAISIAGKGATVMLFGLTAPDATLTVKPFDLFKREITLRSSFINPYTIARAAALIDAGAIDVTSPVADVIPLSRLSEVLSTPALRAKGKYIVNPQL